MAAPKGVKGWVRQNYFPPHLGNRNGELFRRVPGHPQTGKWKSARGIRTPKWPWIIQVFWIDFINCSRPKWTKRSPSLEIWDPVDYDLEQTCTGFLQLTWHFHRVNDYISVMFGDSKWSTYLRWGFLMIFRGSLVNIIHDFFGLRVSSCKWHTHTHTHMLNKFMVSHGVLSDPTPK